MTHVTEGDIIWSCTQHSAAIGKQSAAARHADGHDEDEVL